MLNFLYMFVQCSCSLSSYWPFTFCSIKLVKLTHSLLDCDTAYNIYINSSQTYFRRHHQWVKESVNHYFLLITCCLVSIHPGFLACHTMTQFFDNTISGRHRKLKFIPLFMSLTRISYPEKEPIYPLAAGGMIQEI